MTQPDKFFFCLRKQKALNTGFANAPRLPIQNRPRRLMGNKITRCIRLTKLAPGTGPWTTPATHKNILRDPTMFVPSDFFSSDFQRTIFKTSKLTLPLSLIINNHEYKELSRVLRKMYKTQFHL